MQMFWMLVQWAAFSVEFVSYTQVFSLGFCFFLVFLSLIAIFHLAAVQDPAVIVDLSFCLH